MQWGISFKIPAVYESDLLNLPPPSSISRLSGGNGRNKSIEVFYHFLYNPQSWKEWQRVAAIKKQLKDRLEVAEFTTYERNEVAGNLYTVSELGEHFPAFVKFPKPLFPGGQSEAYKMLCRHSKRLHYEKLLFEEQLIATSIRFSQAEKAAGIRQTVKRAKAAYRFALDHCEAWAVKLNEDERHRALSQAALKSAATKRISSQAARDRAKKLKDEGVTLQEISEKIGVSQSTVKRWLRGH